MINSNTTLSLEIARFKNNSATKRVIVIPISFTAFFFLFYLDSIGIFVSKAKKLEIQGVNLEIKIEKL